jgi:CubicO group peptidase (beta-lactamase class C family)
MGRISRKGGLGRKGTAAAILCLAACSRTHHDSRTARVDALFEQWNKTDAPGCAVGVSDNGAIVYERGYGMANLKGRVPITPETVFPIASTSKSFTAMSVVLAAERGQLSLDDEVQKYIPEWVDRDDHITIRHLLNHTGGLRDAFTLLGWAPPSESAGDQNAGIVRMLARQRGLNFKPGTQFEYNNGGYNLLASILKRATGQSLRAFSDANIFTPLGMTRSHFRDDPATVVPNRASGYQKFADGWHDVTENTGVVGNSGMDSTVGDLLRWAQNFDDVRVGTRGMLAAMQKPPILKDGKPSSYGFGLAFEDYRGALTVGHNGGGHGMATNIMRFPKQRFAIAVLCNEDNVVMGGMARVNPDVFTHGIADIYLADQLDPAEARPTAAPPSPPPVPQTLSAAEVSDMIGLYRFVSQDWPIQISAGQGVLLARSYYQDDFDFELRPVGANRFLLNCNVPFAFMPATAEKPKQWRIVDSPGDQGVSLPVTFVPPASALPSYVGDFHSDEIGVTFTVEMRDAMLALNNHGWVNTTVRSFARDVFAGDAVGIVKFSRDVRGAVTGFTVNRAGAHDVRFERIKRAGGAG